MKIKSLFQHPQPVFSFEFFPPKTEAGEEALFEAIGQLKELKPSFVSMTYGAGGSTRDKTVAWVSRIKHEIGIEPLTHLTCVGSSKEDIREILNGLKERGIENVLALRGDPPKGSDQFVAHRGGFAYAYELVRFIRSSYDFCLGGAGYPEGHPESPSLEKDVEYLKLKVDSGLDFVVTQLFFDNRFYFDYVERARKAGVNLPIVPGIMPISNVAQVERFTSLCGATIPDGLMRSLDAIRNDDAAVQQMGVEHATRQCRDLLAQGAPGIHFYTLNKSHATREIFKRLLARP
ncbi:MAG: methylenetetrahydrofolate reductase [NAD(P)H] [Nitrospirae bacterium]|nr:methylenetetrahydrofolate reductase [NAD(P)H] [Nitrospirota bacterium]